MCKQIPKKHKQLYQRPSLCTACQARSSQNMTRKNSSNRSWNSPFPGFPNSMLATLCANKHQTSQNKLYQRPRLCTACQARSPKSIIEQKSSRRSWNLRFHGFPNSMLATLCANKHQTSQKNSLKDPACAQPAKQQGSKTYSE